MSQYGENAGRVWHILNEMSNVDEKTLKQTAMLGKEDLHAAIGWLAREGKIRKTDTCYSLDETNLSEDIGAVAGRIWKILDIWEDADLQTLKRLSDVAEEEIYSGLGWLAREGKLDKTDKNRYYIK